MTKYLLIITAFGFLNSCEDSQKIKEKKIKESIEANKKANERRKQAPKAKHDTTPSNPFK